ncbi:MAG: ABC transporter substrate-binding protein [Deltaproteobacteria bacterium]|nr:MAG: ABC transporter substrate-binding protein [Deltaproteobacteria bacterium]
MQTTWLFMSVLALSVLMAGCVPEIVPPTPNPIVLGALYSLTGGQAALDVPSSRGAQLAVDEINRAGGVLSRPVQLVVEDAESAPEVVANRSADILNRYPSTTALLGLSDTDLVLAAAPVAASRGRLFLTSGATSPKLPAQVPDYLFLACFGDNVQAAAGAEWAYDDLSALTVSVLFNSRSTYTQLLQGYFRTRFGELGGQVLSVASYTTGEDLDTPIDELQPADLIYLAATPDDVLDVVLALRAAGHDVPILGGDGFDAADLWQEHPEISDVFFTTHAYLGADNDDPKVVAFRQAYTQTYPDATPDAFAALGYDAARLLLTAISHAGSTDPEAVRNALASIREFDAVTGQLGYQADSRIPVKSVTLLGVEGGAYKLVKQLMPDQTPAP